MPYCVHCGIRLGGWEKNCPLCETPIKGIRASESPKNEHPFPDRMETTRRHNRRAAMRKVGWIASLCVCVLAGQGKAWIAKNLFI